MSKPPVYASNEDPLPESAFVDGQLRHLVVGNRGRLLDARRTPITVLGVAPDRGAFVVRIEAFEETGAHWDLPLHEIDRFQFTRDAATVGDRELHELEHSIERFDRELTIDCDPSVRRASLQHVSQRRQHVRDWLHDRAAGVSIDLEAQIGRRQGDPRLYALREEFLAERELGELDSVFATSLVTNPRSGEVVKGHAIVLAELGLCPYRGKIPRDPTIFTGEWSRSRRSDHLLWRLAFTQELWRHLGARELSLFRAAATDGPLLPQCSSSFISATFSRAVAQAHFDGGPTTKTAVLWRQVVSIERALMTFIETRAMNERFHEAEAVLFVEPANLAF